MFLHVAFISGLMIGIEYIFEDDILVLDLGIIRVFVGKLPEEEK